MTISDPERSELSRRCVPENRPEPKRKGSFLTIFQRLPENQWLEDVFLIEIVPF